MSGPDSLVERLELRSRELSRASATDEKDRYMNVVARLSREDGELMREAAAALAEANIASDFYAKRGNDLDASLTAAEASRDEAARALEPFGRMLKGDYSHQPDDMMLLAGPNPYDLRFGFTLGDLRRARATQDAGKDSE